MAKGRLFTVEEDETIRRLFDGGHRPRAIAEAINRPISAVKYRAKYLGLRRFSIWRWSAEDDQKLTALCLAHVPTNHIAKQMQRTISAVHKRAFDLGIKRDNRKTRLATRYGVEILASGKDPVVILAELRELETQRQQAERAAHQAKVDALLSEMQRGIEAGLDRGFMFTAALVSGATLQAIGDRVGVTRERVRQVIENRAAQTL